MNTRPSSTRHHPGLTGPLEPRSPRSSVATSPARSPLLMGATMPVMDGNQLTSVEVCAGAGGQALGLEDAKFKHIALVEIDHHSCETLRLNRPEWNVVEDDIRSERVSYLAKNEWRGVDLLAGGVPCPPFSVAGKQLGQDDERDLFPDMVRLTEVMDPAAVMIENVRGLLDPVFADYREMVEAQFKALGYVHMGWELLNASDYGVPQLRPRVVMVALKPAFAEHFEWPEALDEAPPTVGEVLRDEMASDGWEGADEWCLQANGIAPTLVGGSKKHGGPDLGPTRARQAWAKMGVNGKLLANEPPQPGDTEPPKLTVKMAAIVQGFPSSWEFYGKKTNAYRQVGNAFPPPVAAAVGSQIRKAILAAQQGQEAA